MEALVISSVEKQKQKQKKRLLELDSPLETIFLSL